MKYAYSFIIAIILMSCNNENLVDVGDKPEIAVRSIYGQVYDTYLEKGAPNVILKLIPGNYQTISDSLGEFSFIGIPVDKYKLIAEKEFFAKNNNIDIDLRERESKFLYFPLEREEMFTYRFKISIFDTCRNRNALLRALNIDFVTKEMLGCGNSEIRASIAISEENIFIELYIYRIVCIPYIRPARGNISLLLESGSYNLSLKQKDITDFYFVDIVDSVVYVRPKGRLIMSEPLNPPE